MRTMGNKTTAPAHKKCGAQVDALYISQEV